MRALPVAIVVSVAVAAAAAPAAAGSGRDGVGPLAGEPGAGGPGGGPGLDDGDDGGGGEVVQQRHAPYRLNLRIGTASTDRDGMPTVCAEVRVWSALSVESCGTGSGLWHEGGVEMMHVRGTWEVLARTTRQGRGGLRAGAGFAELSIGPDKLGFQFGSPDSDRVSVAGPELSVSGQWTVPLASGVEAVGTFTAGAGYFTGAPELLLPRDRVQPFASVEIGVGW